METKLPTGNLVTVLREYKEYTGDNDTYRAAVKELVDLMTATVSLDAQVEMLDEMVKTCKGL